MSPLSTSNRIMESDVQLSHWTDITCVSIHKRWCKRFCESKIATRITRETEGWQLYVVGEKGDWINTRRHYNECKHNRQQPSSSCSVSLMCSNGDFGLACVSAEASASNCSLCQRTVVLDICRKNKLQVNTLLSLLCASTKTQMSLHERLLVAGLFSICPISQFG